MTPQKLTRLANVIDSNMRAGALDTYDSIEEVLSGFFAGEVHNLSPIGAGTITANWREDALASHAYIQKLGVLLGCADGDDTPEMRIAKMNAEFEKARQWNALLEMELANLRSLKPTCFVCDQLMQSRGEDGTDFICANCDRAYRESQNMLCGTIKERDDLRALYDALCRSEIAKAQEALSWRQAMHDSIDGHKATTEELYAARDAIASLVMAARDSRCECAEEPEGTDCEYCARRAAAIRAGEAILGTHKAATKG